MAPRTTTDELLAEIGRRIDRLDGDAHAAAERERTVQQRIAMLRRDEARTRAAVEEAVASIEHNVRDLDVRVDLAERSSAADLAEDLDAFLDAVVGELRAWDVYLERRQVRAAMSGAPDRERAEAAITELRRCWNRVRQRLGEVRSASEEARHEGRRRVQDARDEFEGRAAELEAGWTVGERWGAWGRVD
jgi:hypothetical protein